MKATKTKVIATIGPASDEKHILVGMIEAGMNVARLNFSHGSEEEHKRRITMIREVSEEVESPVAIMMDTQGFEIRTGQLSEEYIDLHDGQDFSLYREVQEGTDKGVSVTSAEIFSAVEVGQSILLDDGLIGLIVEEIHDGELKCRVAGGGRLKSRKGVNVPGVDLEHGALTEQDKIDLKFAVEQRLDYVAASFVRSAQDVLDIRAYIQSLGGDMPIIAKIENRHAVNNLEEIVDAADGTMVARGDLGVEVPVEDVPLMQKRIIRTTVMNGKPVITATQMLDSMERNPRPTRAEATDVANAIFDGTSAVMLSGETAAGCYPIESVATIVRLATQAEQALGEYGYLQKIKTAPGHVVTEAVSQAAITMANHLEARAIITLTQSGFTSRSISKYRPNCPILAVTRNPGIVQKLAMNWGVTPVLCADLPDDELVNTACERAREHGLLKSGDRVVVTAGISSQPGSTNLIRVVRIP